MKKIKERDKDFIVIPEAKMVKGEMATNYIYRDMQMGIKDEYRDIIASAAIGYGGKLRLIVPFFDSIKATSRCDERDEYSEKIGVEVCSAKMDYKAHMKAARIYDRVYRRLMETSEIVRRLLERHLKKAQAIEDDMARTYGRSKDE